MLIHVYRIAGNFVAGKFHKLAKNRLIFANQALHVRARVRTRTYITYNVHVHVRVRI